jgi:hypothetical protein
MQGIFDRKGGGKVVFLLLNLTAMAAKQYN